MTSFTRLNLITFSGTCFVPGPPVLVNNCLVPGPPTSDQPTSGIVVLRYTNLTGQPATATLNMTSAGTPTFIWTAVWDSSACIGGRVDWSVYFSGNVQAAQDGHFNIRANAANSQVA